MGGGEARNCAGWPKGVECGERMRGRLIAEDGFDQERRAFGAADLLGYLFVVAALFLFFRGYVVPGRAVSGEGGVYVVGAESLAHGNGYRYDGWLGAPRITRHPPVQAFLLAGAAAGGETPASRVMHMEWAVFALGALAGAVVYVFGRRQGVPIGVMLGVTTGMMTSLDWMVLWRGLSPDFGFVLLFYAGLAMALTGEPGGRGFWGWLWVGVSFAVLYLTRTAVLAWLPVFGVIVLAAGRTPGRVLAALGPVAAAVVGWGMWGQAGVGGGETWQELVETAASNAGGGVSGPGGDLWELLRGEPFLTALGGWWRRMPPGILGPLQPVAWVGDWMRGGVILGGLILVLVGLRCELDGLSWNPADWWRWTGPRGEGGWTRQRALAQLGLCLGCGWLLVVVPLLPGPPHGWSRPALLVLPCLVVWAWRGLMHVVAERPGWKAFAEVAITLGLFLNAGANGWFRPPPPRPVPDAGEVGAWLRRHAPAGAQVAATFEVPHRELSAALGRPLLVDYIGLPFAWEILQRQTSSYPRAEYVVVPWTDVASHTRGRLCSPVMVSSRTNFAILLVDRLREAEFRREKGIPSDAPGQRP